MCIALPLLFAAKALTKTAFRVDKIRCRILYKDNRELWDVNVSTIPTNLDEQFEIVVPKVKDLKRYGNKLVMDIDYRYKETAKYEQIETLFDPRGDSGAALMGFLMIIGAIALLIGIVVLIVLFRNGVRDQMFSIVLSCKSMETRHNISLLTMGQRFLSDKQGTMI